MSEVSTTVPGWDPEDIKCAVRKKGTTLAELSRRAGLCDEAGSQTLARQWVRMERVIAKFLGVDPRELWPERYDAAGRPVGKRRGRAR